ncbi:hypothetical protein CPC08DRAFT_759449 [Agrocybe pediades]|nr:hypothetical protein CPC08DRAFT_759449 [Agrocybe pediades]
MASASSSSALKSSNKLKKRRWTREQLLNHLQLIGDLGAPLPPTLPPSPPASRAASPAAGFKRKLDSSSDPDAVKRPRTTAPQERSQSRRHPPQPTPQHEQPPPPLPPSLPIRHSAPAPQLASRSEPCEDGEVREEPAVAPQIPLGCTTDVPVPIRRPKKGKLPPAYFDALHDKYHKAGRVLKYSGDARWWSTYPPAHREYRPIPNPPPTNSLYHKHGGLIARLELLDALICFTYSIWTKEYIRRHCNTETWSTIEAFLGWCKTKWQTEEGTSDTEKAFLGLIYMIETFIQSRKLIYEVRGRLDVEMSKAHESMAKKISSAATTVIEGDPALAASFGLTGKATPMLPSPSSTTSTPVNREENASTASSSSSSNRPAQPANQASARQQPNYTGSVPFKLLPRFIRDTSTPIPAHVMSAMQGVKEPISPQTMQNMKDLTAGTLGMSWSAYSAQATLNLPLLRRCFPHTWARMMYSTLLPTEEHEPDFEDEEGELYWPDQCLTGDGIGWVCLMGKAMINEFGKAYGYKGLDGVVPKPEPKKQDDSSSNGGDHSQQRSVYSSGHNSTTLRSVASVGAPR